QNTDVELREESFRECAHRDSRRGFARAGTFQNVAGVLKIVLDGTREVGMTRTRACHRFALVFRAVDILHWKRFGPVLPIIVADDDGNGRSDGLRMPNTRDNLDAIGFYFHSPAAPVALLSTPHLAMDCVQRDGNAGRKSGQGGDQALP